MWKLDNNVYSFFLVDFSCRFVKLGCNGLITGWWSNTKSQLFFFFGVSDGGGDDNYAAVVLGVFVAFNKAHMFFNSK